MSGPAGSLNSLLSYRFVKKQQPKLQHADSNSSQSNQLSSGASNGSDSQATIPYNSQQSFKSITDSQETVPYDSQAALSPTRMNGQASTSPNASSSSPIFNKVSTTSSPVFKSNVQQQHSVSHESDQAWMSKSGPVKSNNNFKRIQRPTADSDSDDEDFGKGSGIKVDQSKLQRLKELFPNGDVKRMKAALFAYDKDFSKAVEFMKGAEKKMLVPGKRSHSDDQFDDLPEITKNRKRIKMMPQTPSPTKESGFSLSTSSGVNRESITFLKECFPQKSEEHIERVLKENDGCSERASVALANEGSGDAKLAESLASSGKSHQSQLMKTVKEQKVKANGNAKQKKNDYSDEEDDEFDEEYDSGDSDDSEDLDNKSKSEIDNFLQFFEEATVDELTALPGCSKKKAELIITLRPFNSWDDMYVKFESTKPLSTALISGCKEIMRVRNIIRRLMVRCESMSQQMEKVVATLTRESQHDEGLNDNGRIVRQPELLNKNFSLKPYQLIGLSWLRLMHEQELNGILADEMGLGKTIQAISFLAHLLEEGEEGPHVIIVPSSTIENWLREIQNWCPALKVIVYYGSQDERRAVRHSIFVEEEHFNVLLTTYNMATGGVEDRVLFKKFEFHYAIFDEGHMLKNMSSLRFQNLMKIVAERRLLLTGTPLQNNLLELMSLLCFVMPEIFQGKTDSLKKMFTMISRSEDKQKSRFESERIAQAKRIMKPFVLRRLKKDVLSQLPQKTEKIMRCQLSESQKKLYEGLVVRYAQEIEKSAEESSSNGAMGMFMQFRKAANHPLLLRNLYTDDMLEQMAKKISREPSHRDRGALPKLIQEDMSYMNDFELIRLCKQYKKYLGKFELDPSVLLDSGKFKKLDELLPGMKEKDDRVLLFSQFTMVLDVVEHYLEQRQHKFIRLDGQTPVPDRLQLIDRFNNEPDIFIFLLSTRAGGLGINLVTANTIILHDIDFNPYNDKQAEDRCHRLGQKREVTVIKLISEDTVDESMLSCANSKLALEKDLTGSEGDEETEAGKKDVANLLNEVLKQRQKSNGSTNDDMIEIRDDESSNPSSVTNRDNGLIEIGDEDDDGEDVS